MHGTSCTGSHSRPSTGATRTHSWATRAASRSLRTRALEDGPAGSIGCARSCHVGRPWSSLGHHDTAHRSRRGRRRCWGGCLRRSGRRRDGSGYNSSRGRHSRFRSLRRSGGGRRAGTDATLRRRICGGGLRSLSCVRRRTRYHGPLYGTTRNGGRWRNHLRSLTRLRHDDASCRRGWRRRGSRCRGSCGLNRSRLYRNWWCRRRGRRCGCGCGLRSGRRTAGGRCGPDRGPNHRHRGPVQVWLDHHTGPYHLARQCRRTRRCRLCLRHSVGCRSR